VASAPVAVVAAVAVAVAGAFRSVFLSLIKSHFEAGNEEALGRSSGLLDELHRLLLIDLLAEDKT
jgi:hypothetical protein